MLTTSFFACKGDPSKSDQESFDESQNAFVLIKKAANFPECGIIGNLVAFKFKALKNDNQVVFLIPCPELFANNYFVRGKIYRVKFEKEKKFKDYLIINRYQSEKLPTYQVESIENVE